MNEWENDSEPYKGMRPVKDIDEAVNVIRVLAQLVVHAVYVDKDLERARVHFTILFDAAERLNKFLAVPAVPKIESGSSLGKNQPSLLTRSTKPTEE